MTSTVLAPRPCRHCPSMKSCVGSADTSTRNGLEGSTKIVMSALVLSLRMAGGSKPGKARVVDEARRFLAPQQPLHIVGGHQSGSVRLRHRRDMIPSRTLVAPNVLTSSWIFKTSVMPSPHGAIGRLQAAVRNGMPDPPGRRFSMGWSAGPLRGRQPSLTLPSADRKSSTLKQIGSRDAPQSSLQQVQRQREPDFHPVHDDHGLEVLDVGIVVEEPAGEGFVILHVTSRDNQQEIGFAGDVVSVCHLGVDRMLFLKRSMMSARSRSSDTMTSM